MLVRPNDSRDVQRAGGAIAWKLLLGIAAGVGVIWVAAQSSNAPSEPVSRAVSGPIAKPTAAASLDVHSAPATTAPQSPPSDPFAGVDVSNNSVLRHIARIEEKPRGRPAAPTRIAAAPPAHKSAPPAAIDEPVRPIVGSPGLTREDPLATARSTPAAPALLPIAAVPLSEPNRAVVTTQTAAFSEALVQSAPAPERPLAAPESANVSKGSDRVLVAALGTPAPPTSINAPLRVANRTVPAFPIEAVRAGIQSGRVVARLTIEADGRVSAAQILSATPMGYFERESRRAFVTWRYEPPGRATSADVELVFNRE